MSRVLLGLTSTNIAFEGDLPLEEPSFVPEKILVVVVLALSLTILAFAIFRFDWLKRHMPFFCRWGGVFYTYPASKYGVGAQSIIGVVFGLFGVDSWFQLLPSFPWTTLLGWSFGVAFLVAMNDLATHLGGKD